MRFDLASLIQLYFLLDTVHCLALVAQPRNRRHNPDSARPGSGCRKFQARATHISRETMSTFDVRLGGSVDGGLRGSLKLGSDGLSWTSQNGDRKVILNKRDAESAEWFRTGPKHFQFRVRQSDNVQFR